MLLLVSYRHFINKPFQHQVQVEIYSLFLVAFDNFHVKSNFILHFGSSIESWNSDSAKHHRIYFLLVRLRHCYFDVSDHDQVENVDDEMDEG